MAAFPKVTPGLGMSPGLKVSLSLGALVPTLIRLYRQLDTPGKSTSLSCLDLWPYLREISLTNDGCGKTQPTVGLMALGYLRTLSQHELGSERVSSLPL